MHEAKHYIFCYSVSDSIAVLSYRVSAVSNCQGSGFLVVEHSCLHVLKFGALVLALSTLSTASVDETSVQVLRGKGNLPKARKDAMAVAANAKEFVSHCAAEGSDSVTPKKMTIAQLRSALLVSISSQIVPMLSVCAYACCSLEIK